MFLPCMKVCFKGLKRNLEHSGKTLQRKKMMRAGAEEKTNNYGGLVHDCVPEVTLICDEGQSKRTNNIFIMRMRVWE